MTTPLEKWTITYKGKHRFVACFDGHKVAAVTIVGGGKAWRFENLDDMTSKVVSADQRIILSFVLPMYGKATLPAELSFEEGDIFCTHRANEEIFVYEVDIGHGVAFAQGRESRWMPTEAFLALLASNGYEKAPSLAFEDIRAEAAARNAWLEERYAGF